MKELTRTEAAEFLRSHDHYCILTHRRPDGDTLGSAAALCRILRAIGKQAEILENPEITEKYRNLHEGLTCTVCPEDATLVSVDVAAEKLLNPDFAALLPQISLLIDHHGTNSHFAPQGIVDAGSAACGELIYDILVELGVQMDKATAEALYTAITADTGCFRYSNTTAHTLRTAAACLEAGADTYRINKVLFETNRMSRLKMEAYLAQHLEFHANGTIALALIPLEAEHECGVGEDDMESISNFARNVEGVQLAVTFRTDKTGATKLSVRSAPGYDASRVCAALGGGGHVAAAGAKVECDQAQAREKILEILSQQGYL